MLCQVCNTSKLSSEFPKSKLTPYCKQRLPMCIRCLLPKLEIANPKCPECQSPVDNHKRNELVETLAFITQEGIITPTVHPQATISPRFTPSPYSTNSDITISVSLLGGESHKFRVNERDTVLAVMEQLASHFHVPAKSQRLIHNGQRIKRYEHQKEAKLCDYNIKEGSSLQLMKILLETAGDIPYHIINFILRWQVTASTGGRRAYLDASCMAFCGRRYCGVVDFRDPNALQGINHSGPAGYRTYHTIQMIAILVSKYITHLFFVMSACHLSTLSGFNSPTVDLYEHSRPKEKISDYNISNGQSQSVIMCCMKRTESESWDAFSLGKQTAGFCYNYDPIIRTIGSLYASGIV